MRSKIGGLVVGFSLIVGVVLAPPSHANDIRRNFNRVDREMALNAATVAFDFLWNFSNGHHHTVTWSNPDTGNGGDVTHLGKIGRNGYVMCHRFMVSATTSGKTYTEPHEACLKGTDRPIRKGNFTEDRTWVVNETHEITVRYTREYVRTDSCVHGIFHYDVVNDDGPEKGNSASIVCQKTHTKWAVNREGMS